MSTDNLDVFDGVANEKFYSAVAPPERNVEHIFDVCVVGSGPAGCVAAAIAAETGRSVLLIESGPFKRAQDFSQEEAVASVLYQEGMTQRSKEGDVTILQGRAVGGSSTVNWTSCFRPPEKTLSFWAQEKGLKAFGASALGGFCTEVEEKLHVVRWDAPNANNEKIKSGCEKLGWHWDYISRNVKGCWNIGYCGQGCPTNAKQSALTTYFVDAVRHGTTLWSDAEVLRLESRGKEITAAIVRLSGHEYRVKAKDFIVCAGAIGSPALLFRSQLGLEEKLQSARTFLHPVVTSFARFDDEVQPYAGAPQSVYSDQFLWPEAPVPYPGFKIEAMPLLPMFAAGLSVLVGDQHRKWLGNLPYVQGAFAMQRDGFDERAPGGLLNFDGMKRPRVSLSNSKEQREGFRFSLLCLAEIQFAAGAKEVLPLHALAKAVSSFSDAQKMIADLNMDNHLLRIGSAHVMGGCPAHPDAELGVVNESGRVHGFENCFVFDGSIFPTSLGSNPQITIFSLALKLARERFLG